MIVGFIHVLVFLFSVIDVRDNYILSVEKEMLITMHSQVFSFIGELYQQL
jgi:hypothetical protein